MSGASRSASPLRPLTAWLVLAATTLFLNARASFDTFPDHRRLQNFPHELPGWTGNDLPLAPEILQTLGPGDFLSRTSRNTAPLEILDLFIDHYPSQHKGDAIHSPQNCMPGAGWVITFLVDLSFSQSLRRKPAISVLWKYRA